MIPHPTPYTQEYARGEFSQHGEDWILQRVSGHLGVIFDVGSNVGEWTKMARDYHPDALIYTFEIIPEVYQKLLKNLPKDDRIVPNSFGLSDTSGILPMKYRPDCDTVCTHLVDQELENSTWINGLVFTGDEFMESRRIPYIDYLKIDTEGAEGKVLNGFKKTLERGAVGIIQFEYGLSCILSKFLLVDAYRLLRPLGYHLGQLQPGNVRFHDYHLLEETFQGPDYIAVHESRMPLFI